jgi:Fic family protein
MYDSPVPHQNAEIGGDPPPVTLKPRHEAARPRWPSTGTELDTWVPSPSSLYTKRERQAQTGSYQRAVVSPIADAVPSVSSEVNAQVDEASAEIVRFDAEMGAEIAPFAAILLRTESAASSKIEKLTASALAIATAEVDAGAARNAAEIVANTRMMRAAVDLADHLDIRAILKMHRILMAHQPVIAGRWRTQQVWIGAGEAGPRLADYVPPRHESVPPLMDDLVTFLARTDMPVLVQAALAHAQFETVHPFADGNGRAGRALVHAALRNKGLTTQVTIPVSAGLLTDTRAYFDALAAYRAGDVAPITSMLALAAVRSIANGRELVADLRSVRAGWTDSVKVRRGAAAWRLADLLIRQPVVTTETVASELGVLPNNVWRTLKPFEDAGVLVSSAGSRRNSRLWRAPEVLAQFDSFADRAGRRNKG